MTQIFFILETIIIICISRKLSIVDEWFCVNKLSLYLEKTHFILFTNCKSVKNPVVRINDNVIERVKCKFFWGIYINENLSWMDHISYIGNKLSRSIAILYRVSSIIKWMLSGIYIVHRFCHILVLYWYCTGIVILCNGLGKYIYY